MKRLCLGLLLVLGLAGCKQGEGEVCQTDGDCESDLNCNAATGRCQERGSVVPIDAAPDDASTIDAGPDAG
jgi:hypothetical protein